MRVTATIAVFFAVQTDEEVIMKDVSEQAMRLSAAAAALLLGATLPNTGAAAEEATVYCAGVTGCHGTSDCRTATNACKGQNGCMGQGFKRLTREECARRGGEVVEQEPAPAPQQ